MSQIRALRLRAGMTQEAVAKAAGLCTTTFRNIEAGRYFPWPETLALIARAIGAGLGRPLDVNELLGLPRAAPAAGEETPPSTRSRAQHRQQGRPR